ncbi:MAG TPA: hypothetical protein VFA41_12025 [Ktedonobacteraceae bacterium]|jgi:deoxyadenosine/deoxycytidine kinase|nr:hypothetical protein [Ktedonobacteraceae bacterium]
MLVKRVFFFGRTGSGKSTSVRFLKEIAEQAGWAVESFNDYPILRRKFLNDKEHKQFRPTDHGGFEVLDFSVYEESLRELNDELLQFHPTEDKTLITVEFSSNNYRDTLELFDSQLLQEAHLIFLAADLCTCLNRVWQRAKSPETADDYYVDDIVLLSHYPSPYIPSSIDGNRVTLLHNMESKEELWERIKTLAEELLVENVLEPVGV